MARAAGVARWTAVGALVILVVAIVQILRHPARLWRPGLMGRVLAWDIEPTRATGAGSTAP
jgi:hypothetical protein